MTPLEYRWAHAVNSNALLAAADIIWSEAKGTPVMGHPPATDGDLTLAHFLDAMLELAAKFQSSMPSNETPLIVKLDFKSSRAFEKSIEELAKFVAQYPFSKGIFINADILPGPANSNLSMTLASVIAGTPSQTRAFGGVDDTNANEEEIHREYSSAMVDDMLRVLKPYGDSVTVAFPLRATSVRKSWPALRPLLEPKNFGFTLWWAITQMSDDELEWLFSTLELETHEDGNGGQTTYAGQTFYDIKDFDSFLARRGYSPSTKLQN
ncbi:Protein of unknown function DUF2181 [Phytophthora cactorum]|nr:Protein of unknown function DUF2181 [Phytophthora cactorum]